MNCVLYSHYDIRVKTTGIPTVLRAPTLKINGSCQRATWMGLDLVLLNCIKSRVM